MVKIADAFGRRLRELRRERRLSQEQLAERANLSLNAIGSFERGTRFPRARTLDALVRALELDPEVVAANLLSTGEVFPPYSGRPVDARRDLFKLLKDQPDEVIQLVLDTARGIIKLRSG